MDMLQLIRQAFSFIQEIEPGVEAAGRVGTTIGPVVVQLLYRGKQLVSYVVKQREKTELPPSAEASTEVALPEPLEPGIPVITKQDVALLVDINRRLYLDVSRYLQEKKIDADIIILTNNPAYTEEIIGLPPEDSAAWVSLVQDFNKGLNTVKHAVGAARLHIFLSTPVALAFGMGCVRGTVDEGAVVYHWQGGTYHPVMPISRPWRFS